MTAGLLTTNKDEQGAEDQHLPDLEKSIISNLDWFIFIKGSKQNYFFPLKGISEQSTLLKW